MVIIFRSLYVLWDISDCTYNDPTCMVDPAVDCSGQGKVYIVVCGGCNEKVVEGPDNKMNPKPTEAGGEDRRNYIGMTGTSLHARAKSHLAAVKSKNMSNALALHCHKMHADEEQTFTMKTCTSHRTVLSRYKRGCIYRKTKDWYIPKQQD